MSDDKSKKQHNDQPEDDIQKDLDEILSKLDESASSEAPRSEKKTPTSPEPTPPKEEGDYVKAEDLLSPEALMAEESTEENPAFTTEVTTEGVAAVAPMNPLERIVAVFTNPVKLFTYLKKQPEFWLPLILTIVISMVSGYFIAPIAIDNQIQKIESNPNIPDDAKMSVVDRLEASKTGTRLLISAFLPPLISVPLLFLIITLVFWGLGNFVFARQVKFKQVFSVMAYANLIPLLLGTAIKMPLILTTHSINVQTSPALFLSPEQQGTFLYSFLSSFDVFNVWFLAVFAIGMAVLYEVKRSRAMTLVFGTWLVWIVAKSAVAAFVLKKVGALGMGG